MTASMSDEEIRENLLKLGANVGPVVDSTREFYRRKLARLLGEIKDEPAPQSSDADGSASDNETNEERDDVQVFQGETLSHEKEYAQEDLFSQSYTPPVQIRGRRSTNSQPSRSPTKPMYTSSARTNAPPASTGKGNVIMLLTFVLGAALILYFALQGNSLESDV